MKFLLVLLVFLVTVVCPQVSVKEGPVCSERDVMGISSRGIHLGMDREEVLQLFSENGTLTLVEAEYLKSEGRMKYANAEQQHSVVSDRLQSVAEKNFGFSTVSLVPRDKARFDGIAHYDFGFLDKKLAFFRVYYTKPKWESLEQFVRKFSEILNLPLHEGAMANNSSRIKCGEYSVAIRLLPNAAERFSLDISADVDAIVQQRRKKVEDEEREKDIKTFRP